MKKNSVKSKAVFLDRDGTLIIDRDYLAHPRGISFYKAAFKAIRLLRAAGFKIILVTNQSGIGRGYFTWAMSDRIHTVMCRALKKRNAKIDGIYVCPHRPEERCACRKPAAGMVKKACCDLNIDRKNSFVIGDKRADVYLGWNTGMKGILVLTGKGRKESAVISKRKTSHIAANVYSAAKWILKESKSRY